MADIKSISVPIQSKAIADPETLDLVESMTKAIVETEWRGDDQPFKTKKEAANRAQFLRRHVARRLNVEEKQVRSKTTDKSGKNDEAKGEWVWALRLRSNNAEPAAEEETTD